MVEDPERILRRSNNKADKCIFHLQKSLSLPAKGVKSIVYIILDKKFEQMLLRSKSTSNLSQVVFGLERFIFSEFTQHPSQIQATQGVHTPVTYSPTFVIPPLVHIPSLPTQPMIVPNPPRVMVARFTPLVLLAQLHDLPQGYPQRIRTFGAEGDITAQQHLDRFNDFLDIEEVVHEDAKMRLLAQSFVGEVKKWFRGLAAGSLHNFQEFETTFLRKWECKKNFFQLLTQYNNLKRGSIEFVQDFSTRFMKTYDSIPADVKPPLGAAKLHYAYAFSSEFTLLLRERRYVSMTYMMDHVIKVEVNLSASNKTKQKIETRRVKEEEAQASTSQSNPDTKFNMMMKAMEKLMDDINEVRDQNDPQKKNPNFRRH